MEMKWILSVLKNVSHGPFRPRLLLSLLLTLLLATLNLSLVLGEYRPKTYLRPEQCRRSEYFEVLSLSCVSCATFAEITFASNQSALLESSATDRTVCSCHSGLRLGQSDGKYHCLNHTCAENQVFEENECGICEQSASSSSSSSSAITSACQCPLGSLLRKVIVEDVATNSRSVHFRCLPYQLSMGLESAPCHLSYLLTSGSSCQCPRENYVEEDGQCLPQRALISADTRLQFGTIRFRTDRFVSQHLYRSLRPAVYNCNNLKNQSACHHLLNLCTLKLATELSSLESGEEKWNLCLYLNHLNPNLDFQVDTYYASELQENVVSDQFHAGDTVHIVATAFAHDGHFQQMSTLRLNDLFLCNSARLTHDHISFGTNIHKKCSWKTAELWKLASKQENNHFWDLHLLSTTSKLYPVSVQVSFGEQIATRWMVKRFFLLNSQIGVDLKRFNTQGVTRFVLYPRSVTLQITLSQHSSRGQIYPPVLKVQYEAIDAGEASLHSHTTETEFNVVFQMNDSPVKYHLNLAISIFITFAIFWSIFRTWCWMKRTDSGLDASAIFTFLAIVINAISNTLLLVSLFFVINQLVVFKFQSVIHTVLFTPEQESLVVVYLVVAYILKTIQLFRKIICTTSIDIFFLDWEKPRNKEIIESNGKMEYKDRLSSSDSKRTELAMEMQMTNTHKPQSGVSNLSSSNAEASSSVTIWRSCFVANEWSELNSKRRIDPCLHIFLLILLLECTDLKSFSRVMPYGDVTSSSDQSLEEVPESSTARLAIISTFYILLASIQYLYKKYILENLGWGKLNQFIDLCSVSNISVFCLKYKRFGYYLHGLSPNGRSDVNMLEMYNLLELEESDLCSKRGLMPNTEQQTFEMYLPSVVHDHWSSLRRPIDRASPSNPFPPQLSTDLRNVDKSKLVQAYTSITRFLCSFVEHSFAKADYIVQDRSGVESLFNFEQDLSQKGRFYNDNGHSFENVLLYSIEFTLATFELLTFIMVDLIYRNYILSAVVTFFISKILTMTYVKMSRKNLVHKTLMDERFLI